MLVGALLLVHALLIATIAGKNLVFIIEKLSRSTVQVSFSVNALLGFAWIAAVLQVFHWFHAIDWWAHVCVWLTVAPYLVLNKPAFSFKLNHNLNVSVVLISLSVVAALLNFVGRSGTGDIGDYHLQAIKWAETFPVVKGIGNVRRQLGNNSNWFLLHAFSGMHFIGFKSSYVLNAALLVLAVIYFTPTQNDSKFIFKWVVLMYIVLMSFRKYVGAVTNDYVTTVTILILLSEWILQQTRSANQIYLFTILSCTLISYKLSAIALAIPITCFFFYTLRTFKQRLSLAAIVLCILLPWMYTTYLHSGYLIYPLKFTGMFSPDWQMPQSQLDFEVQINVANERASGFDVATVLAMPFSTWFPIWIRSMDPFSLVLLLSGLVGLFVWGVSLLKKTQHSFTYEIFDVKLLFITIIIAMLLWFSQAPAIRFVFGYLVFIIAFVLSGLLQKRAVIFNKLYPYLRILPIVVLLLFAMVYVKSTLQFKPIKHVWFAPDAYTNDPLNTQPLKRGYVYVPLAGKQCWDGALPCTGLLDTNLVWRGKNMEEGFRIENE